MDTSYKHLGQIYGAYEASYAYDWDEFGIGIDSFGLDSVEYLVNSVLPWMPHVHPTQG